MSEEGFLKNAYELENKGQTHDLYKKWAKSYDEELRANGYASPVRTAEALAACGAPKDAPLLDIGCGTGVSGELLTAHGFSSLQGSDFSQEMLDQAEQKGIYRQLHLADLDDPFHFISEPFPVMSAVGVFAPGHANPEAMSSMLDLMPVGGFFGFSLNDHTLDDPGYMTEINRRVQTSQMRIRWQDYGEHVPGINLKSMIVVLERIA